MIKRYCANCCGPVWCICVYDYNGCAGQCGEVCEGRMSMVEMCGGRASLQALGHACLSVTVTWVNNVFVRYICNVFCVPVCFHRSCRSATMCGGV